MANPHVSELGIELGTPISRHEIITRARSWLHPSVAYAQTEFHENEFGCYRTDCSGYVSMAWGLPGKPPNRHGGLDTVGLAAVSFRISKQELRAGDILARTEGTNLTRHVAIFSGWADSTHTAYWGYEQAGSTGTVYRVISYPYNDTTGVYQPFRYLNTTF